MASLINIELCLWRITMFSRRRMFLKRGQIIHKNLGLVFWFFSTVFLIQTLFLFVKLMFYGNETLLMAWLLSYQRNIIDLLTLQKLTGVVYVNSYRNMLKNSWKLNGKRKVQGNFLWLGWNQRWIRRQCIFKHFRLLDNQRFWQSFMIQMEL